MLFQKYLELGGRLLAFNLAPRFNKVPDGLIFVDLPQLNRRLLEFYMGRDCAARYLRYHLEVDTLRRNTTGLEAGPRKGNSPEKGANEWRPGISTS